MVANFNKKQKEEVSAKNVAFQMAGVLFLIIIVVLIFSDIKMYQKKRELVLQINNYKKQIEDIKKSSQTIRANIENQNNTDYIEKIAYEQLGEQKPGEQEVIFVAPQNKDLASKKPIGFWNNFTNWFAGFFSWIKSK